MSDLWFALSLVSHASGVLVLGVVFPLALLASKQMWKESRKDVLLAVIFFGVTPVVEYILAWNSIHAPLILIGAFIYYLVDDEIQEIVKHV